MKAESHRPSRTERAPSVAESETIAVAALDRLVGDPERLGRFLATTGLDPATIRTAAASPGFIAAVLDHIVTDEALLVAIATESDIAPARLAQAQRVLSPEAEWEP